jgi:hypothetical protein
MALDTMTTRTRSKYTEKNKSDLKNFVMRNRAFKRFVRGGKVTETSLELLDLKELRAVFGCDGLTLRELAETERQIREHGELLINYAIKLSLENHTINNDDEEYKETVRG